MDSDMLEIHPRELTFVCKFIEMSECLFTLSVLDFSLLDGVGIFLTCETLLLCNCCRLGETSWIRFS